MRHIYKVTGDCVQFTNDSDDVPFIAFPSIGPEEDFREYLRLLSKDLITYSEQARFSTKDGKLFVTVEYGTARRLTTEEQELLKEYTIGQWSDGIGEGFEQFPSAKDDQGNDVFTSMWHRRQVVTIEEIEEI